MGFLGGGGGGGQTQTQTIQPPATTNNAVQGPLGSAATRMVDAQGAFSSFNPTQLLPNTTMGQIAMPGPNPTIFGQPYNTAIQSPYFGSAQTTPQQPSPFTGGLGANTATSAAQAAGGGASGAGGGQSTPWDMSPQQMQQMMGMFQQMMGAPGMPQAQSNQLGLGPGNFPATQGMPTHNPLGGPVDPNLYQPQPYYNPAQTNYQPNYQASNGATTPGSGNTTPHSTGQQATGSGGSSGTNK